MKPLKAFQAYKRARDAMETAAYFRERQRSIAIDEDHWALEWQRWERRAARLEARLVKWFKEQEASCN